MTTTGKNRRLASAQTERVVAPGYRGERTRVKITEAGRRAISRPSQGNEVCNQEGARAPLS